MDDLLRRQDQVLSTAQARRALTRSALRHRVSSGRWQQPHPSVLVAHNGPITVAQRRWTAVLAVGEHAVLAGRSALEAAGLDFMPASATVHVLVPARHRPRRPPPDVVVHRTTVLDASDVMSNGRPPRTRPARSLVDAAQWARTDREAQVLVAAAFQQGLTSARDITRALERLPRLRRRALVGEAVADAAGGAQSLAELDFLALCRRHRLPEPSRQVVRRDAAGRRRYLDVLFDEWQVHVEIDGAQHLNVRHAWADMQRQNEIWIAGDRLLRFPSWAVRNDEANVLLQLQAALKSAGWSGR